MAYTRKMTHKLECDSPECPVVDSTAEGDTAFALARAKAAGWTEVDDLFYCPRCSRAKNR